MMMDLLGYHMNNLP